jgi:uncharacterized protein YbjT (DUF2867 family)
MIIILTRAGRSLGSKVVKRLVDEGHEVRAVVRKVGAHPRMESGVLSYDAFSGHQD